MNKKSFKRETLEKIGMNLKKTFDYIHTDAEALNVGHNQLSLEKIHST